MIDYNKDFKELVNFSFQQTNKNYVDENTNPNPFYLGFGNPSAKLLIIGQEKAIDKTNLKQIQTESIDNPKQWKKFVDENIQDLNHPFYKDSKFINPIQPYNDKAKGNKTGATWFYYQKLVSMLYPNFKESKLENPFFEKAFITELNHEVSSKSIGYRSNSEREKLWEHNFYRNFPLVLLSVGNYIKSKDVERLFDVKMEKDLSQPYKKLIVFKNNNTGKIVIQTRQLSSGVSDKLLKKIVKEFKL
ncbi:hypothetical protein [Croceibacter atlanticus]|uniref:hypothetical protein n=1 Tax=Croceibacter atlanticus TaxID=313588 RepID=UPI002493C7F1|nr:hypothetical protein [Croceibacter atlanticus]